MIAPDLRDELDRRLDQTRDLGITTRGIASADELKRLEVISSEPAKAQPAKVKDGPVFIKASELLKKVLPEHRWAVRGVLAEGLGLLVGRPKIGKSWLALNVAVAIASGGRALGQIPVEAGDVLYLALEDNERRLRSRLTSILGNDACPDRLTLSTSWPKLDQR